MLRTRTVELVNYSGDRVECEQVTAESVDDLAAIFASCQAAGRRATLRGGGYSFDGQALNDDLVISLENLVGFEIDRAQHRLRAGAATPWGEMVKAALTADHIPPVVVSSSHATIGGTVSSNSYSRFSPSRGKEITHVTALELVTPAGQSIICSRDDEPELFRAVVGGFGYLGAITRVEVALDPAPKVAHTEVLGVMARDEVLAGLATPPGGARAPARYAVMLHDLARGVLYETRLLDEPMPLHRYRPVYTPHSPVNIIGQLMLRSQILSRLVWWLAPRALSRKPYVDPIADFTFFMDGNTLLVRTGRNIGAAMRGNEQTYLLPLARASEFLGRADEIFDRHRLIPAIADVLALPADDGLMSSTANLPGAAITLGFQSSRSWVVERVLASYRELSAVCGALGGRVHLTKNVVADPDVLAAMYAHALPVFGRLKQRVDPGGVLRNAFLAKNFPVLVA